VSELLKAQIVASSAYPLFTREWIFTPVPYRITRKKTRREDLLLKSVQVWS
jgi:hypothetical protein